MYTHTISGKNVGNNSSFWQYKSFVDILRRFLLGRLQTCMRSLKSTNLLCSHLPYLRKFQNVGIALIAHCDNTPFWIPAGTNKDNLECPIQLKVRFTDGTLDVRLLRVSDSTVRIGVARGGGGRVGWRAYKPPPPCGQLTRCFSAVAELLVPFRLIGYINFYCRLTPKLATFKLTWHCDKIPRLVDIAMHYDYFAGQLFCVFLPLHWVNMQALALNASASKYL